MSDSTVRRAVYTAIGVLILALMLFPVYWMVNASLQPSGNTLTAGILPLNPTFAGYRRALSEQGGNLVTSMIIATGTVVLCLAIATPCAYALSQFRSRWVSVGLLAILVSQMIPGIVIANALYTAYERSFIDFKFGEGAALSNILIAISFVFAIFYLRGTRRAVDE